MYDVSVIDYGIGNLLSVLRAVEAIGYTANLVTKKEDIVHAKRLILPGVGAFARGMEELGRRELCEAIQVYCYDNRPFLGICLGMQMMFEYSEEFGYTQGLGIIPGNVKKIESETVRGNCQKVPHVGWNKIQYVNETQHTIMNEIAENSKFYFTHSYTAFPSNVNNRLADTYYGGRQIAAVIRKGNVYGTQFHPEKSSSEGLKVLRNFIAINNGIHI